jgi:23S rRNA (guanosine2251-2'-O)-methyltransferase
MALIKKNSAELILHNLRSAENVGAIFRTADACGIKKIWLIGSTPAPADKFGRISAKIAKTALGAEKDIVWEKREQINPSLTKFKKENYFIVAIEQSPKAVDYKKVKVRFPAVFILGSETDGLSESILEKCDVIAEIPMKGKKESLNVSVSAGVALYRLLGL